MTDRRFIEETFPVKGISEESAKEKSVRHGHISTLHVWWARKPLAASRSTVFAALVQAPRSKEEWEPKKAFMVRLAKWDNSLDKTVLERARKEIIETNHGKPPKILDPFAGGGAIPLEALRLGCEVYASDYNPVANLILKCTLEYPNYRGNDAERTSVTKTEALISEKPASRIHEDVEQWGNWVCKEAKKELKEFYPVEKDGSIPVGYVWARTIPCQNPTCNCEIPLIQQYWLVKKPEKKVAIYPYILGKSLTFKIVGTGYEKMPRGFEPGKGTISRAVATCLVCGSVVDDQTTRKLFADGKSNDKLMAVVLHKNGSSGKKYRVANSDDVEVFGRSAQYLQEKRKVLLKEWGLDPVPDETLPPLGTLGFRVQRYGKLEWGDLFNSRQKLALITYVEKIREAYGMMLREAYAPKYSKIIATYLALVLDRLVDYNSSFSTWVWNGEFIGHTFTRIAFPMIWEYFELCPWSETTGDWNSALSWVLRVIEHLSLSLNSMGMVTLSTATSLSYPDSFFDAIFTDPPYYDNVPYSYMSDFFYVWLKRSIGHLYPEIFSTPLTPKSLEIVAYSHNEGGLEAGKQFFESMLKKSFTEMNRVLKPNGIAVIVYAHKSTAGWETLVNSLLDSGLVVTGAWPIHTEMNARLRAIESATLASSIYIIARKMQRQETGFYREVKDELARHVQSKLDKLWNEGISGGDFIVAAIGSSIEIFGKYSKTIDDEGNVIRADRLLEDVRRVVIDYAIRQVLHNGFAAEINPLTRFYVLWRWAYGESIVLFDDARKLAQSVGIDLTNEWNTGFIRKDKEFISVLGPEDRKIESLDGSTELIDVLHRVLLLWKRGRNDDVVNVLKESGFGKGDVFFRIAQAISESLRDGKEKKLLEGFLSGKRRITEQVVKETGQTRLA